MTQPVAISLLLKTASDLAFAEGYTKADQIRYLRAVYNEPLRYVLQGAYHPGVKWLIPKGEISYNPAEPNNDYDSKFYREYKKLYVFCVGGGVDDMPENKRLRLCSQLLESIHPNDAIMVLAMKDKFLPYPGINYQLIFDAFPGMLPDKSEKEQKEEKIKESLSDLPPNLDNMSKEELSNFFKEKFGQAIQDKPDPFYSNKGKAWYHNGVTDFLILAEEAEKNGYTKGRLRKRGNS